MMGIQSALLWMDEKLTVLVLMQGGSVQEELLLQSMYEQNVLQDTIKMMRLILPFELLFVEMVKEQEVKFEMTETLHQEMAELQTDSQLRLTGLALEEPQQPETYENIEE
mmetsp:Transcript_11637/g.11572  ORF Transcript_11637/g.11572 Transcript_11637/m.11572 type:complete len:110 (-) Transcript_11637:383-712(-)